MLEQVRYTANFLVVKIIDFDYVKNPTIVQLQTRPYQSNKNYYQKIITAIEFVLKM